MAGLTPYVHTKAQPRFKLLLYGQPGSGKTWFAATAAEMGKTLFLNVEGGMLSAATNPNLLVFDIMNTPGESVIQRLNSIIWAISANDQKENPWLAGLQTIVLDSGSEFAALALEYLVLHEISTNPKRKGGDPNDVYVEDYGRLSTTVKRMFRQFRDLPYNVIITALARNEYVETTDAKGNKVKSTELSEVRPDFTEKACESVMGYVDAVWYAYRTPPNLEKGEKEGKPVILTQQHGVTRAKTRGTKFPEMIGKVIAQPTYKTVIETLVKAESK